MVKKFNASFANKRLMENNREFLMMSKILMKEQPIENCPIQGINGIKKMLVFNQLKFKKVSSTIELI